MNGFQWVLLILGISVATLVVVLALGAIALHVAVRREIKKRNGL